MKFYAVRVGRNPGVYTSWPEASQQVKGYSGAIYKSFSSRGEAQRFVSDVVSAPTSVSEVGVETEVGVEAPRTELTIFTDGSCQDGVGGYAAIFIFPDNQVRELYGHVPTSSEGYPDPVDVTCTNNRAELYAIAAAVSHLEFLLEHIQLPPEVTIYSDSKISVQTFTSWLPGWKRAGWKTSTGKPVENQGLIKCIDTYLQRLPLKVDFEHVYGHAGNDWNERADKLAELGRLATEVQIANDYQL